MARHRDPELLRRLHLEWRCCVLCGSTFPLSLHHVYDRHDYRENLVMLCGDGVNGCHGDITINVPEMLALLGSHILRNRWDIIAYIDADQSAESGEAWLKRRLLRVA